jgi:hypothetical protein
MYLGYLRLPTADIPLPLGSRITPVPQLPASNSKSSQGLNRRNPLTYSPTNSRHFNQFNLANSTDCLLIIPHRKYRSNSSIVAARSCHMDRVENAAFQLLHGCELGICCLATGLHATVYLLID